MGGSNEVIDEPLVEPASAIIFYPSSLAVCLVSGGMDSCVTAAIASDENDELAFLHVSYGQLTERRERRAFDEIAVLSSRPTPRCLRRLSWAYRRLFANR